jgi:hypothetical protein
MNCNRFWEIANVGIGGLFEFMDRWSISRRLTLYLTLWVTYDSYKWAKGFVTANVADANSAWATGAVLAGVTALQGWVFKLYLNDSQSDKREEKKD